MSPSTHPAPLRPCDWERRLSAALQARVEVRYGRARSSVVRAHVEPRSGRWVVRLNAMFADAPEPVQAALCAWLRSGRRARRACATLDAWIDERLERLHREAPRAVRLVARGSHHDLEALARPLLEGELAGAFEARGGPPPLTWGRAGRSRSRHSLRLGSYDYAARVVRVHPVLDQEAVPAWFVRFVLYHELLHAVLDAPTETGRRVMHGPEFRRRERAWPDYERARAWEARHIGALIRSARRGEPLATERRKAPARAGLTRWMQGLLFGE